MKDRVEIVASGFGGQGVVRLGQIIGECGVKQGLHVAMLKSHGTEMRGGYVRSQVVLSEKIIDSPMCESPDYFIALSLAAYKRFKDTVPEGGVIIYDPAFVDEVDNSLKCEQIPFPAKDLSMENFNNALFANSIVLGFCAQTIDGLKKDVMLESLLHVIPKFHERNKQAFDLGYRYKN
ncbi:MAG TPA: 2-oxoglutarate ferredoxin oxidoreductase subunit gamma [Desulfobacteraceae bacterium]|nr:2-oxoglutarate ferredoxin oxidoreductase subunit gamma [Desulfobacteraceae bacterium]